MNLIEDPIEITQLRKQLFLDYLNWILKQLELDPIENITDFYIDRTLFKKIDANLYEKEYLNDMLFKAYGKKELNWVNRRQTTYIITLIRCLSKLNNMKLEYVYTSKTKNNRNENFTFYSIKNV